MTRYPVPSGRSALRLGWRFLPPDLRGWIEGKCGSPVVEAHSQDAGFTPGFASVLVCEDGSRHFVKAASTKAQRAFADAYREEGRKLAHLPPQVAAPALRWFLDDDWVALGIEHVEGSNPRRPWRPTDLAAVLDALEETAERLTPAPPGLSLEPFAAEFGPWVEHWDHVRTTRTTLPHLEDAAALAARFEEATRGTTVVHTDVRDDNVLIDPAGKAWFCDWNWPVLGAPWVDSFLTLLGPRGDGVDVESVIAERPLLRDVPPDHVDSLLALMTGYFLRQGDLPVPTSSPHLRAHQAWHGQVCWDWLAERRGWA